ncbi:Lrp/AsnC family transcriptional regulator [Oscillibacter sp.]|uniref:Lrp/AsnC family transcriptional regulator n=1 Tax=Oscillibacter sp. TaxID=1945593 RepID=UPI00263596B7|nr:Lrp/AsnC family transcriptional regulator [Oscillibacter sp.]MDD3347626.1 Lrp/AsnC family transcriptional regulator [Oscillibacter sp.]
MDPILEILEHNAKACPEDIAKMLGKDPQEVRDTIKKYEADNIILKYKTILNKEAIHDYASDSNAEVRALIEVKIIPQRDRGFDSVAERIYNFPEVTSCYLLSGGYDLLLVVEGATLASVANFVAQKLSPLENVRGTSTHFLLKKYKEDGDILTAGKQSDTRLQVSP